MMASTLPMNDRSKENVRSGRWIPWVFVGLFGLVLVANGTMITIAVSTFTGLETTNAYQKGLAYNEALAAKEEQAELGWQTTLDNEPVAGSKGAGSQGAGTEQTLAFTLTDRVGNPITTARVEAIVVRPIQEGHDQTIAFESTGQGRYRASVDLPLPGQWDVHLSAEAYGKTYRLAKRIHITP